MGNHGMFVGCWDWMLCIFLVLPKFYPFYIQFLVVWMIGCISFLPFLYSCRCYDLNERKVKKSITHLFIHSSLNYPGHLFDPLPEPKKMSLKVFDCHLFFTEPLTKFYGFPDFHGSFLRYTLRKLTWNLKILPWKRKNIYEPSIFWVPCWFPVGVHRIILIKKNGTFRCHEAKISMVEPFGHEALANRRSVMCERPDWWAAQLGNSWDILNLGL